MQGKAVVIMRSPRSLENISENKMKTLKSTWQRFGNKYKECIVDIVVLTLNSVFIFMYYLYRQDQNYICRSNAHIWCTTTAMDAHSAYITLADTSLSQANDACVKSKI